jgi:hypothetical protein
MSNIYPGGDHQYSTNLGLGLWGTDEVTTDNFLLIDAAIGAGVGLVSSVFGRTGAVVSNTGDYSVSQVTGAAPLLSPVFSGIPIAPTAAIGTNTTQIATTAFVEANGASSLVFNVKSYGATGNGSTDDSASVIAAIAAAYTNKGGIVFFPAGTYLINSQLSLPNDGASPIGNQPPIRFTGVGSSMASSSGQGGTIIPNGGSILDLRFSGTIGKIQTLGTGYLEVDHLTLKDGGSDSTTFFFTTNTVAHIHDVEFYGVLAASTGVSSKNDAIILGGTTNVSNGSVTDPFQGYGTVIRDNFFAQIRRAVVGQTYANAIQIVDNTVWINSGYATGGAIEFDGHGILDSGNWIAGNLIEVAYYKYGINFANDCYGNTASGNSFFDENGNTISGINYGSTSCYNNTVLGGFIYPPTGGIPMVLDNGLNNLNLNSVDGFKISQPSLFLGNINFHSQIVNNTGIQYPSNISVIDIEPTFTGTVGNQWTAYYATTIQPVGNSTVNYLGEKQVIFFDTPFNVDSGNYSAALEGQILQAGTGTIALMYGANLNAVSYSPTAGLISTTVGLNITTGSGFEGVGGGPITNNYSIMITSPGTYGLVSHNYGLYINDQTVGGANNPDPWAIFVAGGKCSFPTIIESATLSPTSAGTAGVTGQFAWDSGKVYICTVGGAAGSATWKAATLTAV